MELNNMPSSKIYREERRYSVPHGPHTPLPLAASEDLHAWSIYRQNLNSDFTDSALGSSDKSPLPYGNFQLRDTTVQSILNHPRYGPKSPLGSNMYTYLKFGLPRVFPPNGSQRSHRVELGRGHVNRGFGDSSGPAGSSGYDSSDNETTRSRVPPNLRKYRSESDFRVIGEVMESRPNSRAQAIPLSALRDANSRASIAGTRINTHSVVQTGKHYGQRSHSEADLLNSELIYDYNSRLYAGPNRSELQQLSRSQQNLGLAYPVIQVHCLNLTSTLKKVSLQAKAGDLFAIMATSESEGTSLLECLAGLRRRYSGEILINGQSVSQKDLRELCGFVPSAARSTLDPRMSVHSAMNFHAMLRGPIDKSDLNEKIDMLIEDLGLTTVRTTNISKLTHSEKQRLSVACQLLTQASIMILDQATTNMDIFDTFFLVEYLRQWCSGGRIVIMTLQPPTFEILSMCSGVLLLSGGKTTFSGTRADLPRHMGSLGYPCPPFKNPADYYLDLVTLDDLSAAAMLESSARIESLVNAWEQINAISPIAVPPASLPALTVRAECCGQVSALIKRFIVYKQPGSLVSWISKLIMAGFLSLLLGCIFWDVPATDPQLKLNDRLGYHHCMMAVGFWPIIMFAIRESFIDRRHAERDMDVQLYSRSLYICVQCALGLLPNLCIWLAYLLPAYSMSGLYSYTSSSDSGIYFYIGYMLLYLTTIQTIVLLCVHIMPTKCSSTVLFTAILFGLTAVGGFSVHPRNIPSYWKWAQLLSPEKWLYPILVADEYSEDTLSRSVGLQFCRNKQVQHQEIIVQQQCPPPNGSLVLIDFMLQPSDHVLSQNKIEEVTSIALVLTSFILFILTFLIFILNTRKFFKRKN